MAVEPDVVQKRQVRLGDVARRRVAQHPHHQRGQPLGDDGVAVGVKHHMALVAFLGGQPHPALAPFDEVVVHAVGVVQRGEFLPERDDVLVLLHPIAEHGELLCNFLLTCVDH